MLVLISKNTQTLTISHHLRPLQSKPPSSLTQMTAKPPNWSSWVCHGSHQLPASGHPGRRREKSPASGSRLLFLCWFSPTNSISLIDALPSPPWVSFGSVFLSRNFLFSGVKSIGIILSVISPVVLLISEGPVEMSYLPFLMLLIDVFSVYTWSVCLEDFVLFCLCVFCFLGTHGQHMEVSRLGVESELQLPANTTTIATGVWAMSVTDTTAHGNTRFPAHWGRPGLEPASSWILVRFISTAPPRELLPRGLLIILIFSGNHIRFPWDFFPIVFVCYFSYFCSDRHHFLSSTNLRFTWIFCWCLKVEIEVILWGLSSFITQTFSVTSVLWLEFASVLFADKTLKSETVTGP